MILNSIISTNVSLNKIPQKETIWEDIKILMYRKGVSWTSTSVKLSDPDWIWIQMTFWIGTQAGKKHPKKWKVKKSCIEVLDDLFGELQDFP